MAVVTVVNTENKELILGDGNCPEEEKCRDICKEMASNDKDTNDVVNADAGGKTCQNDDDVSITEENEDGSNITTKRKSFYKRFLSSWKRKLPVKKLEENIDEEEENFDAENIQKEANGIKKKSENNFQENAGEEKDFENSDNIITKTQPQEQQNNDKSNGKIKLDDKTGQVIKATTKINDMEKVENNVKKNNEKIKKPINKQTSLPTKEHRGKNKPKRSFSLGSADTKKRKLKRQQERNESSLGSLNKVTSQEEMSKPLDKTKRNWVLGRLSKFRQRNNKNEDEGISKENMINGHATQEEIEKSESKPTSTTVKSEQDKEKEIFEPRDMNNESLLCCHDDNNQIHVTPAETIEIVIDDETCLNETDVQNSVTQEVIEDHTRSIEVV